MIKALPSFGDRKPKSSNTREKKQVVKSEKQKEKDVRRGLDLPKKNMGTGYVWCRTYFSHILKLTGTDRYNHASRNHSESERKTGE